MAGDALIQRRNGVRRDADAHVPRMIFTAGDQGTMMRSYDTVGELVQVAGCLFGVRAFALFQMNLT
ncbi:MAG TPA: hypothetical protein DEP84_19945, partial [Chloroflexi bacterium]|nr:hypothetical protein [Chloroflexota bacterium]